MVLLLEITKIGISFYKFILKSTLCVVPTLQHSATIKNLQVSLKVPFLIQLL